MFVEHKHPVAALHQGTLVQIREACIYSQRKQLSIACETLLHDCEHWRVVMLIRFG